MNQAQTIRLINQLYNLKLKPTRGKYDSYDAVDNMHIVEIKNRRSYYDTKMIEASKLFVNYQKAELADKAFIYVVTDPKAMYIFNITKNIDEIISQKLVYKMQPSTTDFKRKKDIRKHYYNLDEQMAKFIHKISD